LRDSQFAPPGIGSAEISETNVTTMKRVARSAVIISFMEEASFSFTGIY
jgi:hypothetical protein